MSGRTYSASYHGSSSDASRLREELRRQQRMEKERLERRRKVSEKVEWIETSAEFEVPEDFADFAEIRVPDELTRDAGIFDESVFVSPGKDDLSINLTVFDVNVPEEKCEEIAVKFAQEIYRKATGKEIPEDAISIQPIARLKHPVCQHCLNPIPDFVYRCPACKRSFCYAHRRPESHGCTRNSRSQKNGITGFAGKSAGKERKTGIAGAKSKAPKIIIQKIPCG
jgi:hypothetical protein